MEWSFHPIDPRYKNREAVQGEFFNTDSIENEAQALIREAVQNSLDANLSKSEPVKVRIYISGRHGALSPDKLKQYFKGIWPHLMVSGNGLHSKPDKEDPCEFLVVEDFGTKGLNGDIQAFESPDSKNSFYYFFRAEGQSGKGDADRGRWGIGKFVFPKTSRIKSFFGLTIRSDDKKKLLVGQAILKSHKVKDRVYTPDGWFGPRSEQGLGLPIEDKEFIDQFCQDFNLIRKKETGLSIVIPYCGDEPNLAQSVIQAAIGDYFYPVLSGKLVFEIEHHKATKLTLDSQTILSALKNCSEDFQRKMFPLLEMALNIIRLPEDGWIHIDAISKVGRGALSWDSVVIPNTVREKIRCLLDEKKSVPLRIFLNVNERSDEPLTSYFDVYFHPDASLRESKPVFIREGIIISNVRSPRIRSLSCLVLSEESALAKLLGDAENPSHTQWHQNAENFKGKYKFGASYIRFVSTAPAELARLIYGADDEEDREVLRNIFNIPSKSSSMLNNKKEGRKDQDGTEDEKTPDPDIEPREKTYQLCKVKGGFSILSNEKRVPKFLEVRVAYDCRGAGALSTYSPFDFQFDKSPITLKRTGFSIEEVKDNFLRLKVESPKFSLHATGFDENRDLYVAISVKD